MISQSEYEPSKADARPSDIYDLEAMQALNLAEFPSKEWECMYRLFERRWYQRC